jgi:hypothetical protein
VHRATISAAVLDSAGKLVMEAILETQAETILQLFDFSENGSAVRAGVSYSFGAEFTPNRD